MTGFCDAPALTEQWYVVAASDDVAASARAVRLLGRDFVLWRSPDGSVVGAPDRCPHREAPLSAGSVKDGVLACAYHGWAFSDGGTCVSIPSAGRRGAIPERANLRAVEVAERYGLVWLCPGSPAATIPEITEEADPAYRRLNTSVQVWRTSATRMVDNFLDISHFAFVHPTTIGDGVEPMAPRFSVEQLDDRFTGYRYEVEVANPEGARAMSGDDAPTTTVQMTTGFCLPFIVRGTMQFVGGHRQVLFVSSTPVDDESSLFTFVIWRDDDAEPNEIIDFELMINAEDQRMLEKIAGPLSLSPQSLVSVQSDRASEAWRRAFVELLASPRSSTGE